MARFSMDDGTVIDTDNAQEHWNESTDWDGRNQISRATGDQWCHQTLYKSRKGRYYIVHESQWQGSRPHAEWISPEAAARWLLLMGAALPEDLVVYEAEVSE
jgi:hypothetical protein